MTIKKGLLSLVLFVFASITYAQNTTQSQFPVFAACENLQNKELENCFYNEVQTFIFNNFEVPENLKQNNFQGNIKVLFEVTNEGFLKTLYINTNDNQLVAGTKNVFSKFPKIKPATYNGNPTYSKYTITISIPLKSPDEIKAEQIATTQIDKKEVQLTELDSIVYKRFDSPQFASHLNIPFSQSYYAQFDGAVNQIGANNHTASKPYTYAEVARYYNLKEETDKLKKDASNWWGRKLWNENLIEIQGEDYWFTLNPVVDLQVGHSTSGIGKKTYINTRALNFSGGLGKQINFTTTIYESQGRFADYVNLYAESIKPSGGNPAIIPGIGIAKAFKTDAYDFPSADANITFTPSNYFDLQLGYGRNFIGDGYRSLLESDVASPYPYFKINTTFWKIKYTNTYMWLKDVRPEVTVDKTYATKFMANHYLSWNVSNRLNLGFFESVIWGNTNNRGFDVSFVNPIIFYRTVEFTSSSKSGNAVLGLTSKYKWNNQINLYGQFLLDEFSLGEIKKQNNSWKNKYGYQLGIKYYNAFDVPNLLLQLEYNHVRPYVYSHSNALTNYGHNNQNMGNLWGANSEEIVAIAHYRKNRYYADAKINYGIRGFDFDTTQDSFNYGGNTYKVYDLNRPYDYGVKVGQGNKTSIFIADLQVGYLVNPISNLKLFGSLVYRNFNPEQNTATTFKSETTWFSVGLRTDIFNMYFDY